MFSQLMTEENAGKRMIIYSGDELTFDIAPSIINPQSVSATIAENFDDGAFTRMLATDLYNPNNALSTQFSQKFC